MSEPATNTPSKLRRLALPIVLLVVGLPVGIATVIASGGDAPPDDVLFRPISGGKANRERIAQARWERVVIRTGTGAGEASFEIAAGSSQWRARWACGTGHMRVTNGPEGSGAKALVDSACPKNGVVTFTSTGTQKLRVAATGPWRIVIEQQVHTALVEPALAGMTPAVLIARGSFYSVQRRAEGRVLLYRLRSGRLALRFENFYTTGSLGLEVWFSHASHPNSTLETRRAPHATASRLRSTLGSYNQMLPAGLSVENVRSIVIWCPTVTIAFGAASLRPA